MDNQRWVFVVRALDKPGTLTAAASVFSSRGVSLEVILGSGIAPNTPEDGRLILSFQAAEQKQILLHRALGRLPSVFQVTVYTDEDPRLRAIAIARLSNAVTVPASEAGYTVEEITQTDTEQTVMLTGRPRDIAAAVAQFRDRQCLSDVVLSYIAL